MAIDATLFKRRYLDFHPKLYRVAYALLGSREDAEDMVQEAYIRLWEKRSLLENVKNPEAYAVITIKRLSLDLMRSAKYKRRNKILDNEPLITDDNVERQIEAHEKVEMAKRLIAALPTNQRQALHLTAIKECTMEEIEEITGLKNGNIRSLLSKARKTLRFEIDKIYNKS